jgi:hypothetical protein
MKGYTPPKWWIGFHRRFQHAIQIIYKITENENHKITEDGNLKITEDSND